MGARTLSAADNLSLLQSYGSTVPAPALPWPRTDYDTIWTVKLDAQGNLTVDNALCEGIDSRITAGHGSSILTVKAHDLGVK